MLTVSLVNKNSAAGSPYAALHIARPCSAATVPVHILDTEEGRRQEPILL